MLTMRDLLEDPKYKEYLCQVPKTPAVARRPSISPQWRVFLQFAETERWAVKAFPLYGDAFRFFKKKFREVDPDTGKHIFRDAAINNKRLQFEPPTKLVKIRGKTVRGSDGVVRPVVKKVPWTPFHLIDDEHHGWCPYCRRPTVTRWFFKHHAMTVLDPTTKRCVICGASERLNTKDWYHR